MPHRTLASLFVATTMSAALTAAGLVVTTATAPAADAAWSRPGNIVKYHVCRGPALDGDAWRFKSKVAKRPSSEDARAAIQAWSGGEKQAYWRSGWLADGETKIATIQVLKSPEVRVRIQMEAGDRDSVIGTASEAIVLKPQRIRRCGA